ncbi:MAG: hypothetical protein KIG91_07830 [Treponema sp.]|nr:hypothetical protein [Treponema sp.]
MDRDSLLSKLLSSFEHYYTIEKENPTPPFNAEAEFSAHGEQYMLVKIAKIADMDSKDYAYFKIEDNLSLERLQELSQIAWNSGIAKVVPYNGHRNSDVTLVVLADTVSPDLVKQIKKIKFYKSYKFSFWGWSHFRLVVKEISSNKVYFNRFGSDLKKVLINI